jgi:hypothetical protein
MKNPYVGPRAFEPGEPLYGRDLEGRALADFIMNERIVVLCAPSGAGKTSLVNTLVRDRLTGVGFAVMPTWSGSSENAHFIRLSLNAVLRAGENKPSSEFTASPGNPYTAVLCAALDSKMQAMPSVHAALQKIESDSVGEPHSRPVIYLFDQFEEIFPEPEDGFSILDDDRREFFQQLGEALSHRHRFALFSLRDDRLAQLEVIAPLVPTGFTNRYVLDLLRPSNAFEAIERPARATGIVFNEKEIRKLVDQLAAGRQAVEPTLLQITCNELWRTLDRRGLLSSKAEVHDFGDVEALVNGAIERYLEASIEDAVLESKFSEFELRAWIAAELVSGKRRRQTLVLPNAVTPREVSAQRAIAKLVDRCVLRRDVRAGSTWVELAHDRLVDSVIESNLKWRKQNVHPLIRRAEAWEEAGSPTGAKWLLRRHEIRESTQLVSPALEALRRASKARIERRRFFVTIAALIVFAICIFSYLFLINNKYLIERFEANKLLEVHRLLLQFEQQSRDGRDEEAARTVLQAYSKDDEISPKVQHIDPSYLEARANLAAHPKGGFFARTLDGDKTLLGFASPSGKRWFTASDTELSRHDTGPIQRSTGPSVMPFHDAPIAGCVTESQETGDVFIVATSKNISLWIPDKQTLSELAPAIGDARIIDCAQDGTVPRAVAVRDRGAVEIFLDRARGWVWRSIPLTPPASPLARLNRVAIAKDGRSVGAVWSEGTVEVLSGENWNSTTRITLNSDANDSAGPRQSYEPTSIALDGIGDAIEVVVAGNTSNNSGFWTHWTPSADSSGDQARKYINESTNTISNAVLVRGSGETSNTLITGPIQGTFQRNSRSTENAAWLADNETLGSIEEPGGVLTASLDGRIVVYSRKGRVRIWQHDTQLENVKTPGGSKFLALAFGRDKAVGTIAVATVSGTNPVTEIQILEYDTNGVHRQNSTSVVTYGKIAVIKKGIVAITTSEKAKHDFFAIEPATAGQRRMFNKDVFWAGSTFVTADGAARCLVTGWADGFVRIHRMEKEPLDAKPTETICLYDQETDCRNPALLFRQVIVKPIQPIGAISADGLLVAAAVNSSKYARSKLLVWQLVAGCTKAEPVMQYEWPSGSPQLRDLEFAGRSLFTFWSDGRVLLASPDKKVLEPFDTRGVAMAVSPDGTQIAVAVGRGKINVWRRNLETQLWVDPRTVHVPPQPIVAMGWLNETKIIFQSGEGSLTQVELDAKKRLCELVGDSTIATCRGYN